MGTNIENIACLGKIMSIDDLLMDFFAAISCRYLMHSSTRTLVLQSNQLTKCAGHASV